MNLQPSHARPLIFLFQRILVDRGLPFASHRQPCCEPQDRAEVFRTLPCFDLPAEFFTIFFLIILHQPTSLQKAQQTMAESTAAIAALPSMRFPRERIVTASI